MNKQKPLLFVSRKAWNAELCEVGKRIWENKNEAFYHDYVSYGSNKSATTNEDEEVLSEELEEK